jgi:hypothetical protein
MKEIIELLNQTNGDRLFLYSIVFLLTIGIVARMVSEIVDSISKAFYKKGDTGPIGAKGDKGEPGK